MSDRVSSSEVAFLIVTVVAGFVAAYYTQPLIHGNSEALSMLATVFSVLAGLLIGVITLLSDVSIIPGTGWRVAVKAKPLLKRRLHRHRLLFLVYLATLFLLLASLLIPDRFAYTIIWLERIYILLGTVGFLYSFRLPWSLARIQEERLDSIIQERRQAVGLDKEPPA